MSSEPASSNSNAVGSARFDPEPILKYLGLPPDCIPSPIESPVNFLDKHVRLLPPHLLVLFSTVVTPQQRTILPIIRNRRQKYTSTYPRELSIPEARKKWPQLWQGRPGDLPRPGLDQGKEEKLWADRVFFGGQSRQQVGKLGGLLAEYEEEREAERVRETRKGDLANRMAAHSLNDGEEEEEEEEDKLENGEGSENPIVEEYETQQQIESNFERAVHEKFIYGLLDDVDYDAVDWDDQWDEVAERDYEEQWFDEEEAADAPSITATARIELEYAPPPPKQGVN